MSERLELTIGEVVTAEHMNRLEAQTVILAVADDALPPVGIADGTLASVPSTGTLWIRSQGGWYRHSKVTVGTGTVTPSYARREWADGQTPTQFQINSFNVRSVQVSGWSGSATAGQPTVAGTPVPENELGTLVASGPGDNRYLWMWVRNASNTIELKRLTTLEVRYDNNWFGGGTMPANVVAVTSSSRSTLATNGYHMWSRDTDSAPEVIRVIDCLGGYEVPQLVRTMSMPAGTSYVAEAWGHCIRVPTGSWPLVERRSYTDTAIGAVTHTWPSAQPTVNMAKAEWSELHALNQNTALVRRITPHRSGGLMADVQGQFLAWSPSPGAAWQLVTDGPQLGVHVPGIWGYPWYGKEENSSASYGVSWLDDEHFIWCHRVFRFDRTAVTAATNYEGWRQVPNTTDRTIGWGRRQFIWNFVPQLLTDLDGTLWDH